MHMTDKIRQVTRPARKRPFLTDNFLAEFREEFFRDRSRKNAVFHK